MGQVFDRSPTHKYRLAADGDGPYVIDRGDKRYLVACGGAAARWAGTSDRGVNETGVTRPIAFRAHFVFQCVIPWMFAGRHVGRPCGACTALPHQRRAAGWGSGQARTLDEVIAPG